MTTPLNSLLMRLLRKHPGNALLWDALKRRWKVAAGALLLLLVSRTCGLVAPLSARFFIDQIVGMRRSSLLLPLVGLIVLATAVQGVAAYLMTLFVSKEGQRLVADLRVQVQQHVGLLPLRFYDTSRSGALTARVMSDVEGIRNLLGTGFVEFAGSALTAVGASLLLLWISPAMAAIVLALLFLFGFVLRNGLRKVRPLYRQGAQLNSETTARLTESFSGIRVVKAYRAESRETAVVALHIQRALQTAIRTLTTNSAVSLSAGVLIGLAGAAVMLAGGENLLHGRLTMGSYYQFTMLLAFVFAPVIQIVTIGTQVSEAYAGLDRTFELLNEQAEHTDNARTRVLGNVLGHVRFQNVRFSYEKDKPVLHHIDFEAESGSMTALIGPSGAGKTTIASLLCGFYKIDEGQILIDGHNLAELRLDAFRANLGIVLQDPFLFAGTIRDNVLVGNAAASERAFLAACRTAHVHEFAERLPDAYDTLIGERGLSLSGGQRQRISLARAILADPRILILDEATSSLDSESERLIQQGLASLMQNRTTFVIAHRLSTIRRADQILVLDRGRIVERGTHEELYRLSGMYRTLYDVQYGIESGLADAVRKPLSAVSLN